MPPPRRASSRVGGSSTFRGPAHPGARMHPNCAPMFAHSPNARLVSRIVLPMDAVDRKILAELQLNGRLTLTELADRVQLSLSPCQRRLRRLEGEGTIRGYRA